MKEELNIAAPKKYKLLGNRKLWDPVGDKIGKLTVLREVEHQVHPNGKTSRRFECVCDCGNHSFVIIEDLKRNTIHSCGHCGRPSNEYEVKPGSRYGRLVVIREGNDTKDCYGRRVRMVECKCDCGKTHIVPFRDLRYGNVKSCGCLAVEKFTERFTKHGLSHKHPLYHIWKGMRSRCMSKSSHAYRDYGGRGITLCDEWKSDFKSFYDWSLQNGWSEDKSIDRIDNNKGYSPDNCRYTDRFTQARNKRSNLEVVYKGRKWHCLAQFCEDLGLDYRTIYQRIKRGLTIERAITLVYRGNSAYKKRRNESN